MREFTVNEGRVIKRDKDGAFNVPDQLGKTMLKTGEFTRKGINLQVAPGYRCTECGFVAVYRDSCGRCGGINLVSEA